MDFNSIDEIKKAGFSGFIKMSNLFLDSSILPDCKGVYFVLFVSDKKAEFLNVGTGGYFKGKNPNVNIEILESHWVDKTNVVYIGKATSLNKRLKQYFKFGQGKNIGHYGGRFIWQLENSNDLVVCWKSITNGDPREYEFDLIKSFVLKYGKRPFANLCD